MDLNFVPSSDISGSPLTSNGLSKFSNRAARFYWADDEQPSSHHAYSIQQLSDSHFEENPLVIASISAGVIGVAIIIVILVGIWIRSRLFSEREMRSGGGNEHPNNASVTSSMSTLDEDAYVICMEMNDTVLGSMHNIAENCENSSEMNASNKVCETNDAISSVPSQISAALQSPTLSSVTKDDHIVVITTTEQNDKENNIQLIE